jgi:hypothetical protein
MVENKSQKRKDFEPIVDRKNVAQVSLDWKEG